MQVPPPRPNEGPLPGEKPGEPSAAAAATPNRALPPILKPRAHEVLEEEHFRRFRQQFNVTLDGEVITTMEGIIEDANLSAASMFGCPRAFLRGKPLPFFAARANRSAFYTRLVHLGSQPDYFPGWVEHLQPVRGEPFDAALFVTRLLNDAGQPEHLRWVLHDLRAVRQATESLRAEQAFVEYLLEVPQLYILVVDVLGRILRYNPYLEQFAGYERLQIEGQDWRLVLLPPGERTRGREIVEGAPTHGFTEPRLCTLVTRQRERRTVSWSARAFPRTGGKSSAVLLVGHDVTDMVKAQDQAVRTERLAAIGHMVAALAHESRNALQRGTACLQRLRWRLQERPEELDLVDRLQSAQDDLLQLYDDVRNYAAPLHLDTQPRDLSEIWQAAWDQLAAARAGRDAELQARVEGGFCAWRVDGFRMTQVFRNLFQNALEACPDPIRIEVTCRQSIQAGEEVMEISVRDNGPGLSPDQRARLFEPFYTTKIKGTGLGLAIVRRLIEAQGGRVAASDRPPPGAEFLITFPGRQP